MKTKTKLPKYIEILIAKHPSIISGRKNFEQHHLRIINSIKIIKKYFNINNKV